MKVIDPVCGMEVDTAETTITTEYQGQTYYFCGPGCKTTFLKEPNRYVGGATHSEGGSHLQHHH